MYFNVYSDSGSTIEGYLIPDGFSACPSIYVDVDGERFGPFECDVFLASPYEHKHHETGVVGFKVDEKSLPGITYITNLAIADADTGFIFYRRLDPERHISRKVFRLETQISPHNELDNSLKPHFQFYADRAEMYGSETVRQMLEIANQPSSYVSGRVHLRTVQKYFTDDTVRIASLRDPFYELALRIWSVSSLSRRRLQFFSERDKMIFGPAIEYFADLDFAEFDSIARKVQAAPKSVLTLFESPFTHQLVASNPTDHVDRDGISVALDALSQFTLFDASEENAHLATDIAEFFGFDPARISFAPLRPPFIQLACALREIKVLEHVLETDLILSHFIRKATIRVQK